MLVPFKELPDSARVWIYQSDREFNSDEIELISNELEQFLVQWTAHGTDLKASFHLPYNRFIVIGLDESHASASGCSIDSSVRFIQQLQDKFQVDLLDKMNVTFKKDGDIRYKPLKEFRKMAKSGNVGKDTIVFNNLVNTKYEYQDFWEVPASESWHARFVK